VQLQYFPNSVQKNAQVKAGSFAHPIEGVNWPSERSAVDNQIPLIDNEMPLND